MDLYNKTIITISIVLINTLVIIKNKKISTSKFLFLIIINSFFATILLLNNSNNNKYIKYLYIKNRNNNYKKINCSSIGLCQISENNFNLLPNDLKKLAYESNKNINCNKCNLINMPKCPFNNIPNYIKLSDRLENDIPDIITPDIPDGTLMDGLQPLCKVKNNIILENSKIKRKKLKHKICPKGFDKKKNGICKNKKNKYCIQGNVLFI